jgi:hypothetical protein
MSNEGRHPSAKIPTLLKARATHNPSALEPRKIVYWLRIWQPEARDIRSAGKCPECNKAALVSYIVTEFYRPMNNGDEKCGYYCGWCGWGNAGRRDVVDHRLAERKIVRL